MIINQVSNVIEVAGEGVSKSATINSAEVAKLQYLLTEGLYKDAESATIVELSNNGVDSIIESGKDPIENPVIVELSSQGGYTLSITDQGIGMNKVFFEDFFMNLLSSTKGGSNDYIGSFGVGGKSWASLHRSVTFTIIQDGWLAKYICYKGEKMIDYDLIYEEETTEPNGVKFEMPINDWREYDIFKQKAKAKLLYYDTVVLIIDGKVWENKIYRNDLFQYSDNSVGYLHICLKDVIYNLDYSKLGISPIVVPVAIRFGLDEGIGVTLSREDILYSKDTIQLIKDRIGLVANYMVDKYNNDLQEPRPFLKAYNEINVSDKYVVFNTGEFENRFCINSLIPYSKVPLEEVKVIGMELRTPSWYKSNMYQLMENFVTKAEYTSGGVWKTTRLYTNKVNSAVRDVKSVLVDDVLAGNVKDYVKEKVGTGKLFVTLGNHSLHWYRTNVLIGIPKAQWRDFIVEYQGVIKSIQDDWCMDYRDVENRPDYQTWLAKRIAWKKENRGKIPGKHKVLNKEEGDVTIAYARWASRGDFSHVFEKNTYKIADLHKTKHIVITFFEEEKEKACQLAQLLIKEKVAIVGKREITKITAKQFKTFDQFMEDNKPFRRLATALLAQQTIQAYDDIQGKNSIIDHCIHKLKDDYSKLKMYKFANNLSTTSDLQTMILDLAKDKGLWDMEMLPVIERLNKSLDKYSFIKYLSVPRYWDDETKKEVNKLVNRMLLFQKKYYSDDNFEITLNP